LRGEQDWLRIYPGKILVHLTPDALALQSLPRGQQAVALECDSRMQVYQLKDLLSQSLQAGIPGYRLMIKGTSINVPLKGTLSLAYYNIANDANLTFTLSK